MARYGIHSIFAVALAAGFPGLSPAAAMAQDFLKGRNFTIIVGFSPGGGYDTNARVLSRHIGRHIPGKPNVIVQNMPGAGSLKAVHYLSTAAPADGSAIVTFNFGQITLSRVLPEKSKADFRDYAWIGSISQDLSVCYLWHKLGPKTIPEVLKHGQVTIGNTAVGSASYINQAMLKGVFGVKIHQVAGYPGSAEQRIAVERGELDGDCGAWSSIPEAWVKEKRINVLVKFAPVMGADLPADVPYALDIAPDERSKKIIRLLTAATSTGRPYITARKVASDRVAALRTAFDATMQDAAFKAELEKLRLPYSPLSGAESEKIIAEVYEMPADIVAAARKIVEPADKGGKAKR